LATRDEPQNIKMGGFGFLDLLAVLAIGTILGVVYHVFILRPFFLIFSFPWLLKNVFFRKKIFI